MTPTTTAPSAPHPASPAPREARGQAATGSRYNFYLGATAYDGPSPIAPDEATSASHLHIGSFSATDGALGTAALDAVRAGIPS